MPVILRFFLFFYYYYHLYYKFFGSSCYGTVHTFNSHFSWTFDIKFLSVVDSLLKYVNTAWAILKILISTDLFKQFALRYLMIFLQKLLLPFFHQDFYDVFSIQTSKLIWVFIITFELSSTVCRTRWQAWDFEPNPLINPWE